MNLIKELLNENITSMITDYKIPQLQKLFNIINRKAFNGELPPIKIKLNNDKRYMGALEYRINHHGDAGHNINIISLRISKFKNFRAENIVGILAHEMVHYKICMDAVNNAPFSMVELTKQQNHGAHFKKIAKMVSMKIGNTVPVAGYDKDFKNTGIRNTGKAYNILAFVNTNNTYSVMVVGPTFYKKLQTEERNLSIIKRVVTAAGYAYAVIGTSTYAELAHLTSKRSFGKTLGLSNIKGLPLDEIKVAKKITK